MSLSTYHLHTTFSDGKNTAEEMIKQAIALGCTEIGFSDHSPFDFECSWDIKKERISEYVSTLTALKEKYKDKIKV
ncbi:MAG: PHP domain-containing protein, partial [Clostridia bacterium]|nr:PHP domain-containing protein [Clostridia bacterium]